MKQLINKSNVDAMAKGVSIVDTKVDGFIARKLPSGKVSYGYRYRGTGRKQWWLSLGVHGQSGVTAETARSQAKVLQGRVAAGKDPGADKQADRDRAAKAKQAGKNTVNAVLDLFIVRHVEKNLRSAKTVKRCLEVYVRPRIGSKSIYELKRRDIVEMLDAIEDADKAVTADRVLAYVRKAFNWYATRDDDFLPPIVRGMARTKPADHARVRALADDEIRSLWKALDSPESPEPFRNIVRVLLLTAQRRDEIGLMRSEEIDGDTLVIPAERYKTGIPNAVPLTKEARQWIGDRKAGFMFSTTGGKKAFSGYSKAKLQLDAVIAEQRKAAKLKPMPEWRLHDLRRTARSLMSRAGVSSDVAEMVLGHKLSGVRGVYDRHSYAAEKRSALEMLARLIGIILNPPKGNVVPIARGQK
jgi:integrase